jgi:colicin import membrane protein
MTALDRPIDEYQEPGKTASAVLAAGMHVLLAIVLFFGIRWQNRPPEAVSVELWTAPPAAPVVAAPPAPPPPAPKVEPRPEPKPEPPPVPKVEAKPPPAVEQADIALEQEKKRKLEEERKLREEAERQRKLAEQKKLEEQRKLEEQKRAEEQKRLEEQKRAEEQKRQADEKRRLAEEDRRRMQAELNRELSGSSPQAGAPAAKIGPIAQAGAIGGNADDYRAKIAAKIRGNVILPPDLAGNPEAEFDVTQLPNGEVLSVKLRKSSGSTLLDDAWERAIRKSSPLPKPDRAELFQRDLRLRFRPKE